MKNYTQSFLSGFIKPSHLKLLEDDSCQWHPRFLSKENHDSALRFYFILNQKKPMELSLSFNENQVIISFSDFSKPDYRMNKEDIFRSITMSQKCSKMLSILQSILPPIYELRLCNETQSFLTKKHIVFLKKWRFDHESFKRKMLPIRKTVKPS